MERVLNESEEPARQDSASAFRDSGAIDKGVENVVGGGSAIIGYLHICHF